MQTKRYRTREPPSSVCKDHKSVESRLESAEILNGRPWTSSGPLVGLYHPVFVNVSTNQHPSIEPLRQIIPTTQQGRALMIRLAMLPALSRLLGISLPRVKHSDEPDVMTTAKTLAGDDGLLTVVEVKFEPSIGGDAKIQQFYARTLPEVC